MTRTWYQDPGPEIPGATFQENIALSTPGGRSGLSQSMGHISREKMGRRVLIAALVGIAIQTIAIMTRSATVATPALWPIMYLVILMPIGFGIFLLWRPFWLQTLFRNGIAQPENRRKPAGLG